MTLPSAHPASLPTADGGRCAGKVLPLLYMMLWPHAMGEFCGRSWVSTTCTIYAFTQFPAGKIRGNCSDLQRQVTADAPASQNSEEHTSTHLAIVFGPCVVVLHTQR